MLDQRCDVGEDRLGQVRGQPALVLSMVGVGGAETVQQHDGSIDQRRRTERNRVDGRSGRPDRPQRSIADQHDHVGGDGGAQRERVGVGRHRRTDPAHRLQPAQAPPGPGQLGEQCPKERRRQAKLLGRHRRCEGNAVAPMGWGDVVDGFAAGVGEHRGVERVVPMAGEALGGLAGRHVDGPMAQRLDHLGPHPGLAHLGGGADAGDEQVRPNRTVDAGLAHPRPSRASEASSPSTSSSL